MSSLDLDIHSTEPNPIPAAQLVSRVDPRNGETLQSQGFSVAGL
jgi:hypothetical protein